MSAMTFSYASRLPGTTVPAGATTFIATAATHHDEVLPVTPAHMLQALTTSQNLYPNSSEFDPFRFDKLKQETSSNQYLMTSIHQDYMLFGQGRHAWYAYSIEARNYW